MSIKNSAERLELGKKLITLGVFDGYLVSGSGLHPVYMMKK